MTTKCSTVSSFNGNNCGLLLASCVIDTWRSTVGWRGGETPQHHTKMCLAGISCHAHKVCGSSPLRVRHLALFWLILRCLTHDKEKKYSSCPKNVIPLAQIWSGTYLKKMLHAQEQVRQPYWICRISRGVLVKSENLDEQNGITAPFLRRFLPFLRAHWMIRNI